MGKSGKEPEKTAITILSLSLSVVLLNITVTLTNSFDMDKYLSNTVSDFLFANAGYFQVGAGRPLFSEEQYSSMEWSLFVFEGFESEKRMYLLCGGVLCFIIGLIGILNFFNIILTNIIARRREFAVLQAVGMTGRQLKRMLIAEGELLTLGSACFSLLLTVATAPLTADALSSMLWLFSYRFTVIPLIIVLPFFILLGVFVPCASYRQTAGKLIMERLD